MKPIDADRLSLANVVLVLLEDGIRQSRAPGLVLSDITAAALARPEISEGIHAAIVETAEKIGERR